MCVYVDGVKVAKLTTNSFSESRPTREAANKDSGIWSEKLANRGSWSASATAYHAMGGSYQALKTKKDAGAPVVVMFSTAVSGDEKYQGNALITELSLDAPDDDNMSFSVSFEGTGALTEYNIT